MTNAFEAGRYTTLIWVGIGIANESWGLVLLFVGVFSLICVGEGIWQEAKKRA